MGPQMAALICNAVIFCSVVRKLSQRKVGTTNRSHKKDRNRRLKVSISLAVILGLNWFAGLLLLENTNNALQWIFVILVGSHGFAIFIAQVVVHRQVKRFTALKISSSSSATGTNRYRSSSTTSTLLEGFLLNFCRSSSAPSDSDILSMKNSRMGNNLSHTHYGLSPSTGSYASGDALMFSSDFKTTRNGKVQTQSARPSVWSSAIHFLADTSEFESDISEAVGEFSTVEMANGESLDCHHSGNGNTSQLTMSFNSHEIVSQKKPGRDSSPLPSNSNSAARRHSVDSYFSSTGLSSAPMLSAGEQARCRDSRSNSLESGCSLPACRRRSLDPWDLAGGQMKQPKLSYAARARLKREQRQATQNGRANQTKTNPTTHHQRENDSFPQETKRRSTLPASFPGGLSAWSQPVHESPSFKSWFRLMRRKRSDSSQPCDAYCIANSSTAPPDNNIIPEEDEVFLERCDREVEEESDVIVNPSPATIEEDMLGSQVKIAISVTEY